MKFSALVSVAVASVALSTSSVEVAEGATNDSSCVQASQRDDLEHMQIALDFRNECTAARACAVSWVVKCDGKPRAHRESIAIAPSENKTLTLSAKDCDGEWEIQSPSWNCRSRK